MVELFLKGKFKRQQHKRCRPFSLDSLGTKGKIKTENFVKHIEALGEKASDNRIEAFTADAWDLIKNNEWGVGLENLLSNIYEIEFIIDNKAVDLAKDAIAECKMNYNDWTFIEELVR